MAPYHSVAQAAALQAAKIKSITDNHPLLQAKGKARMAEEPSHVKQLTIHHMCKIGLKVQWHETVGCLQRESERSTVE
jgi:hypothetical protein